MKIIFSRTNISDGIAITVRSECDNLKARFDYVDGLLAIAYFTINPVMPVTLNAIFDNIAYVFPLCCNVAFIKCKRRLTMIIKFNRRVLHGGATDFEATTTNITFTCTELAGAIVESNLVTSTLDSDVWFI